MSRQNLIDNIIEFIRKNRVSTTEILDIFNKNKAYYLPIMPLNRGHHKVGNVFYTHIIDESNAFIHLDLIDVVKGSIVFVENTGCCDRAVFGSLVCKYLFLYKEVSAVVVCGNLRDGHTLIEKNYPVWCNGLSAVGCFNKIGNIATKAHYENLKMITKNNMIIVCDDSGVAFIPHKECDHEFLQKLEFIEKQEDKWFQRINEGHNTYSTVVLKDYIEEGDYFDKFAKRMEKEKKLE